MTGSLHLYNREALAIYAGGFGYSKTAEVGVYDGKYSEVICRHFPGLQVHYCIDTWQPSRNHRWQRKLDSAFATAQERLKPYNVIFKKTTSLEAVKDFKDNELDFVYIDALHDYRNVRNDINAWYPIVRYGGMLAGHDWTHAGVTRAVTEFAEANHIEIRFTERESDGNFPSWYFIKE